MDNGADLNIINKRCRTAILYSAMRGHWKIVQLLVDHGVNLNINDKDERTPLYYLCREGDKEMVKSLISKGANPSNKNCLSKALELYHKDVVKTLINSGANLNNIFLFFASIEWKPFWQNLQLSLYSWHNLCSELKYFRKAI